MSTTPLADPAAAATGTLPEPCVLIKLGEVVLKGGNRQQFERMLQANIRRAIADVGGQVRLWQRDGVIVIRVAQDGAAAPALAADRIAVRARRRDKRFAVTSAELAIRIGARVQQEYGYPVNLKHPDTALFVEVDQREVFVYTEGYPGQGGLPVGMSGRGLVLMSGGIDSPVAAYRMMRRGLRCDFLHFSGMPLTGPESVYKAYGLMHQLDRFQGGSRLFVVAFGKAQQRLAASGASRLQIMAQRRLMLKTAEVLAGRLGAAALITGDSLGQVSSQTLANLTALDDAVGLPILRPLIGRDKVEIMAEARRIRTLALSELPDQDCCTLLTPRHVETQARIDDLRRIEARLEAGDLAEELAGLAQEYRRASPRRLACHRAGLPLLALLSRRGKRGSQRAAHERGQVRSDAGDLADIGIDQCLVAVAQRHLRLRVHVDDHAVGADRDSR